jgi:hypothetical protein
MTSGSRRATSCEKAGQSLFIRRSRLLAFHVRNLNGSSVGLPSTSPPAPVAAPADVGPSPGSAAPASRFLDGEPSLGTGWKKRFIACGLRRRLAGYPRLGTRRNRTVRNWTVSIAESEKLWGFELTSGHRLGLSAAVCWSGETADGLSAVRWQCMVVFQMILYKIIKR